MSSPNLTNGEFQGGKFWFERSGSTLVLGLTDSGIEAIGEIEAIDFPEEGQDYNRGEALCTIDGSLGRLEMSTPASGVIHAINEKAKEEPEVVTDDPLEEGWLIKLELEADDLEERFEELEEASDSEDEEDDEELESDSESELE